MTRVAPTIASPVTQLPGSPLAGTPMPPPGTELPWVVAHRGLFADGSAVENTIPAYRGAIALGVESVETDVLRTRDGVLILNHDPDIVGVEIAQTDYADLPLVGGRPVPRLSELVALVAEHPDVHLMAELKAPGFERQAVDEMRALLGHDRFSLTSFDTPVVQAIEAYDPAVHTGLLAPRIFPWMRENPIFPIIARLLDPLQLPLRRAAKAGADMIGIDRRMVTDRTLDNAAAQGIDVAVWTVNDHAELGRLMLEPRIAGVITDEPRAAQQARDGASLLGGG